MSQPVKLRGSFPIPLILFGFLSLLLGTMTELMGAFSGLTDSLRDLWRSGGLEIQSEMGLPGTVGVLITAAACFGVVAAILGTPGGGRRFVIGFSAFFLSMTLIPAFAVWGIFWKPFGMLLAVFWSCFSAMIYAQTHVMPCDETLNSPANNVIRLEGEHMTEQHSKQSDG